MIIGIDIIEINSSVLTVLHIQIRDAELAAPALCEIVSLPPTFNSVLIKQYLALPFSLLPSLWDFFFELIFFQLIKR